MISFTSPEYPESYVLPTYVYFMNDATNLYVLVDAQGDQTNNPTDECLLVFNFDETSTNWDRVEIVGSSDSTTWQKSSNDFEAAIGFSDHKVYEFSVPFSFLGGSPGDSFDFASPYQAKFGSMPYDAEDGGDNIWPLGFDPFTRNDWGILNSQQQQQPQRAPSNPPQHVGGELFSANKVAVLSPYLALFSVVAVAAVIVKRRRI